MQNKNLTLPDIEKVCARVHDAWIKTKQGQGVSTRMSENGEELMVPYDQLSEKAKDLDRGTVNAVYQAIEEEMGNTNEASVVDQQQAHVDANSAQ